MRYLKFTFEYVYFMYMLLLTASCPLTNSLSICYYTIYMADHYLHLYFKYDHLSQ